MLALIQLAMNMFEVILAMTKQLNTNASLLSLLMKPPGALLVLILSLTILLSPFAIIMCPALSLLFL